MSSTSRARGSRARPPIIAQGEDGRPRFVAGALGPTNRTASISPDVANPGFRAVTFDELRSAYGEQVEGLIEGGADLLLIETIFDTLNAKAAIYAIADVIRGARRRVPVMISGTITDRSGRLLSGQTPAAFWNSVRHAAPFSIGLNCALGAKEMRAHIAEIAPHRRHAGLRLSECRPAQRVRPLRRKPGIHGRAARRVRGRRPRQHRRRLLRHHARAYPRHRARRCEGKAPRQIPEIPPLLRLSGLEAFTLTPEIPFVNVGERTNVTGSAKFRKLVTAGDYAAALAVARDQVENGAQIIDVNMDEGLLDSEKAMTTFLNLIAAEPDIARVPVMVDSSKFSVIEAGLKCMQGKPVVNSISHEGGRGRIHRARQDRAPLRRRRGGDGVRRAGPGRHARAQMRDLPSAPTTSWSTRSAFRPRTSSSIPNIFAIATGMEEHNGYGVAFIEAARWIRHEPAARARLRRRVEPVVLVPRQRAGARGDALGVSLSRHQGRHGHGHRQCRADGGLRRPRSGTARGLRGRGAQPPRRRGRAAAGDRRALPRPRQGEEGGRSRLARMAGGRAALARAGARHHRFHREPTPRRRGSRPSARCT